MSNIIFGLVAVVLGVWGLIAWWETFGVVMRGLIPFALIIFGLLFIASKYYKRMKAED